jgi:hypothetical protein
MLHTLCLLVFALVVSVLLKLALVSVRVLAMAVTTTAIAAATIYAIAAPMMTSCWYACIRVRALAQVHIYSWYTMRMQLTEHLA